MGQVAIDMDDVLREVGRLYLENIALRRQLVELQAWDDSRAAAPGGADGASPGAGPA